MTVNVMEAFIHIGSRAPCTNRKTGEVRQFPRLHIYAQRSVGFDSWTFTHEGMTYMVPGACVDVIWAPIVIEYRRPSDPDALWYTLTAQRPEEAVRKVKDLRRSGYETRFVKRGSK